MQKETIPFTGLLIGVVAAAVRAISIRFPAGFSGDELFYWREVVRLQEIGWWNMLTTGTSFLYIGLSGLLTHLTGSILLSNRLLSLIPGLLVIWSLWKMAGLWDISLPVKRVMLLTALAFVFDPSRSPFLFGTNDALMFACVAEGVYRLFCWLKYNKLSSLVASAVLFGMGFWVREITLMYLIPLYGAALLYLIFPSWKPVSRRIGAIALFSGILLCTGILVHLPALSVNGTSGFEDKNYMGNWRERDYLSQIRRQPSGSVFAYERVEWAEVRAYKNSGLKPELPATRLEILRRDPKMVADAFASNLLIRCTYLFTLRNGLLFFLFLASFWLFPWVRRKAIFSQWILLILLITGYTLEISAITLHRIEIRWLTLSILFVTLAGSYMLDLLRIERPKLYRTALWLQYAVIGLSLAMILI
ncbi:MAG TPA: glycosyltransferase family 39 protein [Bacteroidales bacterium]|nr:glycosyltransferase family 39 protein [Bacteroidales bacterium]HRZ50299.1 glycosyltransferase family 39 protein [Bacteroidales bacterium]